ncbi:hypothetical protein NDU88_005154 [Pleurodeles waltl]|uniref:Uncharacterized protein n=1 Tax=Pleurodeles waltl TaxID=8319 RepID=A0AAV7LKC3_PLEWA|nr:hypothetical protein NDU88_005154 [Pleurodeles waltl]
MRKDDNLETFVSRHGYESWRRYGLKPDCNVKWAQCVVSVPEVDELQMIKEDDEDSLERVRVQEHEVKASGLMPRCTPRDVVFLLAAGSAV